MVDIGAAVGQECRLPAADHRHAGHPGIIEFCGRFSEKLFGTKLTDCEYAVGLRIVMPSIGFDHLEVETETRFQQSGKGPVA